MFLPVLILFRTLISLPFLPPPSLVRARTLYTHTHTHTHTHTAFRYFYITFLGYMTLPFLEHTQWIIYLACVIACVYWILAVVLRFNPTVWSLSCLF